MNDLVRANCCRNMSLSAIMAGLYAVTPVSMGENELYQLLYKKKVYSLSTWNVLILNNNYLRCSCFFRFMFIREYSHHILTLYGFSADCVTGYWSRVHVRHAQRRTNGSHAWKMANINRWISQNHFYNGNLGWKCHENSHNAKTTLFRAWAPMLRVYFLLILILNMA